jgi:hypothetical protein
MSWLGKSVGNHIAGANKYLHKVIGNGSNYLGKLHQGYNNLRDKYAETKNEILGTLQEYNPNLRDLAETGIGFLEGEAQSFLEPIKKQVEPFLNLGSGIGKLLQNY